MSGALASDVAMVMGAGLGTRMRPLTNDRPKPLVEVAGKAMIDHCLDRLADAGVARAVVNVHYLPEMLVDHLSTRQRPATTISDERDALLETGGGMVKALTLIGADPFFTVNSDNLWLEGPVNVFQQLSDAWDAERMDGLLLLVPHSRAHNHRGKGDFHLDPLGRISRRRTGRIAPFIWTGIQLIGHSLLADPPAGAFSTNILWDRAIARGRLFGISHVSEWFEVGSPEAILPTEQAMARG
ncbi:nucleotidyltransferase family protein [Novosphingobium tardum]|uniref:Nucleotidyltransferase family protein n=1 Tax=Novosphingobium tardum TaxID=1538021 RepID=A0ABV8RR77_9SPHN